MAYRLHQLGSRWAIYDVAVDGISLVSSYRSQFARIIQTSSYGELMRRLRSRDAGATTIEPAATR
jgi:phospholipid transport system substrate-binding protein